MDTFESLRTERNLLKIEVTKLQDRLGKERQANKKLKNTMRKIDKLISECDIVINIKDH